MPPDLQHISPDTDDPRHQFARQHKNKPPGWSRKSNAPYYKEAYALQVKVWIDKMIQTKEALFFSFDQWCVNGMSRQTFYNRLNQSVRYLLDYLDPTLEYKTWYDSTRRNTAPNKLGIIWEYRCVSNIEPTTLGSLTISDKNEITPEWLIKLRNWIESSSSTPFVVQNLVLTKEQVHALEAELNQIPSLTYQISYNAIMVVKS